VRMLIVDVLHEAGYRTMEASDGPKALKVVSDVLIPPFA
jgi:CheY-like chemotaxis protein